MTKVRQTLQINHSDFIKFARFAIETLYIGLLLSPIILFLVMPRTLIPSGAVC